MPKVEFKTCTLQSYIVSGVPPITMPFCVTCGALVCDQAAHIQWHDTPNARTEQRSRRMTGVELIAAERERQITEEHWTPTHDRIHADGELAQAAMLYACPPDLRQRSYDLTPEPQTGARLLDLYWPKGWDFKPTPADRIRELVKAGALIAAEIDRLAV